MRFRQQRYGTDLENASCAGCQNIHQQKDHNRSCSIFVLLIGGLLIYVTLQVNWATATTEKFGFDLRTVDITKHLNTQVINILLSMIVVLTLMLVERYVSTNLRKLRRNQVTR